MIITTILTLLTVVGLIFPGYFPMHDDLQVMRLFQLEQCFGDGQIPCRWVPDMTFGFGQALFNFYSAFPYYLGILIRLIFPLSIMDTVKLLFGMSLVGGSLGMYLLAKEFFGRWGAGVAAILYAFAPYRAVDVYVRGAMAESFSLALLPFLWLSIYKAIKWPSYNNAVFVAITLAAVLTTHNISSFMYFGFTVLWTVFWIAQNLKIKNISVLLFASTMGVALAGFFIVPVFFEQILIREEIFVSDYSKFSGHFVSLNQLFLSRFWGYGGSIFGENDGMSFQVGWPHWWLAIVVGLFSVLKVVNKPKAIHLMILILLGMSAISLFMTHNKSTAVWLAVPMVEFVQFPWRFLGMAVFLLSFAAGGVVLLENRIRRYLLIIVTVVLAVLLNINYFRPERTYDWLTDEIKLSGEDFLVQQKAAALDYLPATVEWPPLDIAPNTPILVAGEAELPNLTKTSNTFFFDANIYEDSVVDVPIIYFPEWEVYLLEGAGVRVVARPSEVEGLIRLELPKGNHMVYGRFVNTPARTAGNILTVVSFFILVSGAVLVANKKSFIGLR